MANHKWDNNKCIYCGIFREEIKSADEGESNSHMTMYQYTYDGKSWTIHRPDCKRNEYDMRKDSENKPGPIKEIVNHEKMNGGDFRTKSKRNYSDLLKNPKWQKKRLEIMQRDNWICRSCNDCESELHVHHLQYSEEKPWDEPDENLITLCDTCHKAMHYITSCPDIDIDTFVLVIKLYDDLETESINKYLKLQENG